MVGDENFQSWKQKVLLTLRGFDLESHLVSLCTIPRLQTLENGANVVNLEFARFQQCYNALAYWLLASSICSQVNKGLIGCMTTYSILNKLHQVLSSSSTTRIMSLYDQLKVPKLTHQYVRDYRDEIQSTCDSLSRCGHAIEEI